MKKYFPCAMTKPRISNERILLGILGKSPDASAVLREWNSFFRSAGIDGSMDRYPCTEKTIPERLSEMVHFDRRGYIVASALQTAMLSPMDTLDGSAIQSHKVDTIINDNGVLTGYFTNGDSALRRELWFGKKFVTL
jgi:shikimate dehydrogenase